MQCWFFPCIEQPIFYSRQWKFSELNARMLFAELLKVMMLEFWLALMPPKKVITWSKTVSNALCLRFFWLWLWHFDVDSWDWWCYQNYKGWSNRDWYPCSLFSFFYAKIDYTQTYYCLLGMPNSCEICTALTKKYAVSCRFFLFLSFLSFSFIFFHFLLFVFFLITHFSEGEGTRDRWLLDHTPSLLRSLWIYPVYFWQ